MISNFLSKEKGWNGAFWPVHSSYFQLGLVRDIQTKSCSLRAVYVQQ